MHQDPEVNLLNNQRTLLTCV